MSDNFDLVKFLKESKAIENLNPIMKGLNDKSTKETIVESIKKDLKNTPLTENKLRDKIREMILAEMGDNEEDPYRNEDPYSVDSEELIPTAEFDRYAYGTDGVRHYNVNKDKEYDEITAKNAEMKDRIYKDKPEHDPLFHDSDLFDDNENYEDDEDEEELYEAKKDEVEDAPVEDEELDFSTDGEDVAEDPLKTAAAGATGDSKELINHLMTALDSAKAMGNEKLTTQILNTLKFAIDQSMGGN